MTNILIINNAGLVQQVGRLVASQMRQPGDKGSNPYSRSCPMRRRAVLNGTTRRHAGLWCAETGPREDDNGE